MGEYPISTLLLLYENGKLCLPEIQRDYVWDQAKVAKLIDSLYHDIPIGQMLFWKPTSIKHLKPLKGGRLKDPEIAIIDGQQRLSSLYDVDQAIIPVVFNINTEKFQIENKATKANPKWVSVYEVWHTKNSYAFIENLSKKAGHNGGKMSDDERNELGNKINEIIAIKKREPAIHTIMDDDYEKITEIFIRINESGKKLQKSEIALAVGALKFPGLLMKKLADIQKKNQNWQTSRARRNSFFVNALATITTNTVKMSPFQEHLLQTTAKKIKDNLKELEIGIDYTYEFLETNFGINEKNNLKLIPNLTALLALVNYRIQTHAQLPKKNSELLTLWTFLAFYHSQYSGKAYRNLDLDIRAIDPSNSLGTIKTWIKSIKDEFGQLQVDKIGNSMNSKSLFTVFFALKLNKAFDWWTGSSITAMSKTEYHHIFPKKVLEGKYSKIQINDPRNIAIVSEKMNRKIGGREPKEYFIDTKLIPDIDRVFTQFVPKKEELWKVKNYEEFLDERGKMMKKKLNEFVSSQEAKI